jgi:hypothetical protein
MGGSGQGNEGLDSMEGGREGEEGVRAEGGDGDGASPPRVAFVAC